MIRRIRRSGGTDINALPTHDDAASGATSPRWASQSVRTTPFIRQEIVDLVEPGEPVAVVARRFKISRTTVYEWLRRFDNGDGLENQRSVAASFPTRVARSIERKIEQLRCKRRLLGWRLPASSIWLARLRDLEPPRITQRYEYARPGELVHIDIKKLARFHDVGHRIHGDRRRRSRAPGFDTIYVAVDDASRRAHTRIYDRESAEAAADFLRQLAAAYARSGVRIERVMTQLDSSECEEPGSLKRQILENAAILRHGNRHNFRQRRRHENGHGRLLGQPFAGNGANVSPAS